MTTEIVDITYREYTTDGRFIAAATLVSTPNIAHEDIETILDPELTPGMESYYISTGLLSAGENLQTMMKTNVIVRHPGTGRFMKWVY